MTKKEKLRWVDLEKSLRKQLQRFGAHRGGEPLLLFKVQYYVNDLKWMKQEISRYVWMIILE